MINTEVCVYKKIKSKCKKKGLSIADKIGNMKNQSFEIKDIY